MANPIIIGVTSNARLKIANEIVQGLASLGVTAAIRSPTLRGVKDDSIGGIGGPTMLERGEFDMVFLNPSHTTFMALNGIGPYDHGIKLTNIAVFPSWDRLAFAVKEDLGIASLSEISEKRLPLKISIRGQTELGSTAFAINTILSNCGWSPNDLRKWGGQVDFESDPSSEKRLVGIKQGHYHAIFDEGIRAWGPTALKNHFKFIPFEESILKSMEQLGYRRTVIPPGRLEGIEKDCMSLDFGGWPLCCRDDLPDDLGYEVAHVIDNRKQTIPVDIGEELVMSRLCRDTDEGPFYAPLHSGAERYYREHQYL